jgi:arylsulfatase A-like enzyme
MLDKPNILIPMTDEQRAARDWPARWADANLPSLGRLRAHGINFN